MIRLTTRSIAFVCIFTALYYVLSILPGIPAVLVPEVKIELEACLASVFGLILGPYLGALTAFMGAFVAWILPPGSGSPYGLPFLASPVLNALVVGLIYKGKWKVAFIGFAALIVAFWFTPPPQPWAEYYYIGIAVTWDKIIALLFIIPAVILFKRSSSPKFVSLFYFLLSFIGNQADNAWGSDIFAIPIVYEGIFGYTLEGVRGSFIVSPFIYPAIRIVQAIIATLIAVPLMKALESAGLTPLEG